MRLNNIKGLFFNTSVELKRDYIVDDGLGIPRLSDSLYRNKGEGSLLSGDEFYGNADLNRAVNMISEHLSMMDFKYIGEDGLSQENEITYILNKEPVSGQSGSRFWWFVYLNIYLCDESFVLIHRNKKNPNIIEGLEFVKNSSIVKVVSPYNEILKYQVKDSSGSGKVIDWNVKDMLHLYFRPNLTNTGGYSPLRNLVSNVKSQKLSKEFINEYLQGGNFSSFALIVPTMLDANGELLSDMRDAFVRTNKDNRQAPIMIDGGMDIKRIEANTDLIKVLSDTKLDTEAMLRALGMPMDKFNFVNTSSSAIQTSKDYLKTTLMPLIRSIEGEINLKLLSKGSKSIIKLNYEDFIVKDDDIERQKYQEAYALGVVTKDEYRSYLGLPILGGEDGNKFYMEVDKNG